MTPEERERLAEWVKALERRHLRELTFTEVRRALQALSALYVQQRERLPKGAALDGAGKRAAFALFFGPMHHALVAAIVVELGAGSPPPSRICDLGCGTGAAGAAWALADGERPRVEGVDLNSWAVGEANWTYRALGVAGHARRGDLAKAKLPAEDGAVLAAFTVNELTAESRARLLERLLAAARTGAQILVIEPIARRVTPWWGAWSAAFAAVGGRDDVWRFESPLPPRLHQLDRAAGLDHRTITARSLWIAPRAPRAQRLLAIDKKGTSA